MRHLARGVHSRVNVVLLRVRMDFLPDTFGVLCFEVLESVEKLDREMGILNRTRRYWDTRRYSTGSGSDRAPYGEVVSIGARSLPLPVLYRCYLVRFRLSSPKIGRCGP